MGKYILQILENNIIQGIIAEPGLQAYQNYPGNRAEQRPFRTPNELHEKDDNYILSIGECIHIVTISRPTKFWGAYNNILEASSQSHNTALKALKSRALGN